MGNKMRNYCDQEQESGEYYSHYRFLMLQCVNSYMIDQIG